MQWAETGLPRKLPSLELGLGKTTVAPQITIIGMLRPQTNKKLQCI